MSRNLGWISLWLAYAALPLCAGLYEAAMTAKKKAIAKLTLEVEYEIEDRSLANATEHIKEVIEKIQEQASVKKATFVLPQSEWEMI